MEESPPDSFSYRANVKERVKKLESSMLSPEEQVVGVGSRWNKKSVDDNATAIFAKEVVDSDERPAVMDVEITQIDSTSDTLEKQKQNNTPSINSQGHQHLEPEATGSVSVKGLLKKFTNGVVSVSHPFRRNSSVSSNDISNISSQTSQQPSQQLLSLIKQDQNANEIPNPKKKTNSDNAKNTPILRDDEKTARYISSHQESKSTISVVRPIVQAKVDQAEVTDVDVKTHIQTFNKSSSITNEQESSKVSISIDSGLQKPVVNTEPSPKPKPRVRIVIPTSSNAGLEKPIHAKNLASIFLMGPMRAGKSSIVNYLVRQDLLPIHKQAPSTREIIELTAKVKIDSTTDLFPFRIIDTPGFENKNEDASLFSTLISHLDDKDGLQGKPPTLALVTIGFETWKKPGQSENLVNFLKVISHYHTNFFESRASNFLFVVTHSTTTNMEKFQDLAIELSNLIRQHTSLTDPLIVFHGITQNLGTSKVDNESSNLLNGIKTLLKSKGSELTSPGHMVLSTAFGDQYPNSIQECVISKRLPLRTLEHPEALKTQKSLQYIYLNIEATEISTLLEIGWENVDKKLREAHPSSLLSLQQLFQKIPVRSFSELPEEPLKVLSILRQMPYHNLATTDLLLETIQLRIPSCYPALIIGQGYDVSKDAATHVSPFLFSGKLNTSPVGLIPEEMNCRVTNDREIVFRFYYSFEEYVLDRMKDLSIKSVTFPTSGQTATTDQKSGYNVIKPNQEPTKSSTAKAMIEYRVFQLSLGGREDGLMVFKPQFWETVSTLPDLDIKKSETVDSWKEFFNYWGTHVIKSAFGGGSVQVNFRGKMLSNIFKSLKQDTVLPSDEYDTSKVFQWCTGDGLDFLTTKEDSKAEFLQGFDVDTSFQGGDMKFQQTDLTKLSHDKVAEVREEWIQSLPLNPLILETNLTLIPLSYFVREKSEGIATKMDLAFHHFYANFMAANDKQTGCSIL